MGRSGPRAGRWPTYRYLIWAPSVIELYPRLKLGSNSAWKSPRSSTQRPPVKRTLRSSSSVILPDGAISTLIRKPVVRGDCEAAVTIREYLQELGAAGADQDRHRSGYEGAQLSLSRIRSGRGDIFARTSGGETFKRFLPHTPSSNRSLFHCTAAITLWPVHFPPEPLLMLSAVFIVRKHAMG